MAEGAPGPGVGWPDEEDKEGKEGKEGREGRGEKRGAAAGPGSYSPYFAACHGQRGARG